VLVDRVTHRLRCLQVAGVWASDTTHLGMCFAVVYHYTISEFANPAALNVVYWRVIPGDYLPKHNAECIVVLRPVVAQVMFNGITAVLVQGCVTYCLCESTLIEPP
jgi:hypothetical protein